MHSRYYTHKLYVYNWTIYQINKIILAFLVVFTNHFFLQTERLKQNENNVLPWSKYRHDSVNSLLVSYY